MSAQRPAWTVLLIGGPSGVGKTIAAERVGRRFGSSWLQVDDLRLALQHSRVTLPVDPEALYFFQETPDVWRLPPEQLRDGLIAVGAVLSPAIEIVIANHVDTVAPVVIEGDGILPSVLARPSVRDRAASGHVRAVFLVESDENVLLANMMARCRGIDQRAEAELRTETRANWLYGQWLAKEARRYGLAVMEPRPWATLAERIVTESGR